MPEQSIPIYSEQELNKLLEDPKFSSKIGGYSTFSLGLIRRGFASGSFAIPTYGPSWDQHISLDLHPDVFKEVFGIAPISTPFPRSLYENRGHGSTWAAYELYCETVRKNASFDELDEMYLDVHFRALSETYERTKLTSIKELIASCPILLRHGHPEEDIRKYFRFDKSLIRVLEGMKRRKGIQVLYGDRESLTEFVSDPLSDGEGIDDAAIAVARSIPGELVLGFIPLGEYEKAALIL
ncbi:hypothetical protein HYS96_03305 [Candidatus Daviesbacteria bacterium]|nr:hypothetical protein [Candidatus Daviesbacteria bacterium]